MKYNAKLEIDIVEYSQRFSSWYMVKTESSAGGADEGTIQIIDERDNEWPLRNFVANALLSFRAGTFSVPLLTFTDNFSTGA